MQTQQFRENTWVIRLNRRDEVIKLLTEFCEQNRIEGGLFYGLGAVDQVELALYDVEKQKYHSQRFEQPFEVTNITGSIGIDAGSNELIVHAHITLSDEKMQAMGGHLVGARVSGTMELILNQLPRMEKIKDDATGLKIFKL